MMTNCTFPCTCRSHNTKDIFNEFVDLGGKINSRYDAITIGTEFRSVGSGGRFTRYFFRPNYGTGVLIGNRSTCIERILMRF